MLVQNICQALPKSLRISQAAWRANFTAATERLADDKPLGATTSPSSSATSSDNTSSTNRLAVVEQLRLLGPPELYRSDTTVNEKDATGPARTYAFFDTNSSGDSLKYSAFSGPTGQTENRSPTYTLIFSSGNSCLDFFFHVVPDTLVNEVIRRLESAWDQDPLIALKLVFNLRGVRGTGKFDRDGFYSCALWLHENHPKTLSGNVGSIAEFGYFEELLEILYRLLKGPTARKDEMDLLFKAKREACIRRLSTRKEKRKVSSVKPNEILEVVHREEMRLSAAKEGMERYYNDPAYRLLHNQISEVFTKHLRSDLEKLNSGDYNNLSFAAKWCPSLYSTYDDYTMLCESIGRRLFPREKYPEYEGIEEAHYAYRVRDRLRKEVLVPLRRALKLPEVYMCAQEWSSVVYTQVASIAMKNYAHLFDKYDRERFREYLDRIRKGKAKVAAGALLPHELVRAVRFQEDEIAELQWKRIVKDLSESGKLTDSLAICDVSGSMYQEPLEVSIALGLLVSELSKEPWKGKLITFSTNPQMQVISEKDLRSKFLSVERMDWGMNTDFQRVFDEILEAAIEHKITEDQMIKRLFVFSDMEFDKASGYTWETDYQAIVRKFNKNGFTRVPEIVFWNLRNSNATPVPCLQKGVSLVSGFSKNLVKLFLDGGILDLLKTKEAAVDGGSCLDPVSTMEAALAGEEYQKLVVLD